MPTEYEASSAVGNSAGCLLPVPSEVIWAGEILLILMVAKEKRCSLLKSFTGSFLRSSICPSRDLSRLCVAAA